MITRSSTIAFVGVGAPKCGTNLLARVLALHPRIHFPPGLNSASLDFFTDRYPNRRRGFDWYLAQFGDQEPGHLYGEISPSYFSDPDSPSYIQANLPQAKAIVILRDPVKRAYSSFQHDKRHCRVPADARFLDYIDREPKYLGESQYTEHLKRHLDTFGPDQLHVVFLEELRRNSDSASAALFAFLGVDPVRVDLAEIGKVNEAWRPRSFALQAACIRVSAINKALRLHSVTRALRRYGGDYLLARLNRRAAENITPNEYSAACERLRGVGESLKELLQLHELPWENSHAKN